MIKHLQNFFENTISTIWLTVTIIIHYPAILACFITPLDSKCNLLFSRIVYLTGISFVLFLAYEHYLQKQI
ncbi:hypothetical protein ADH76_23445 [Enterocloster clostridioformis]|nr:hypothetical protein [Enterocloster clostridioformis]OXE65219.1 hypothetical protein ADH76_23445 [Enterocloster clostridioformis]